MKRQSAIWGLVIAIAVLSGCGKAAGEATVLPTSSAEQALPGVSVRGKAVPAAWATLSAQAGGVVLEVPVKPGDEVASGELLVRIDPADAQLAIQQAQAALEVAQAQLALAKVGPRPEEIAAAQAQVEAADAAIAQAVAQRDQLDAGATRAEIAAAEAQVAEAEAEQRRAREAHDQTMKCYDVPGGGQVCPLLGPTEEQARYALNAAEQALAAARAQLNALTAGAGDKRRAAEAAVAAAEAQRASAQAQLDLLQAGVTPEQVTVAEATVAQADAALAVARLALERCEVRAPFAGTVGAVHVRTGELAVPGQPLVVLGDLSMLWVETTDLDDVDVAQVAVGQRATVAFEALPGQSFAGRVAAISPMAEPDYVGGENYTVIVELDNPVPEIRWGMDAFVTIEVE